MPIERPQNSSERNLNPETEAKLNNEIVVVWNQLPLEQQATMALTLVKEIQKGEWGNWLIGEIMHQQEEEKEAHEPTFPVYSLNWGNMESAFSEEEIVQLGDQDLKLIAEEMRVGFLFDSGFWFAVKMIGQRILEERDNSSTV